MCDWERDGRGEGRETGEAKEGRAMNERQGATTGEHVEPLRGVRANARREALEGTPMTQVRSRRTVGPRGAKDACVTGSETGGAKEGREITAT